MGVSRYQASEGQVIVAPKDFARVKKPIMVNVRRF